MKKLLNTLYITNEDYYLSKDNDNIVILNEGKTIGRFPKHIISQIICFNYVGCSPAFMKMCMEENILLSFLSPGGWFCGRVIGPTNGNVLLRRKQFIMADNEESLEFVRNIIYAKAYNSRKVLERGLRDHKDRLNDNKVILAVESIINLMDQIKLASDKDSLRGLEGSVARIYFSVFDELIFKNRDVFYFFQRTKRPPLDCVNALLSFLYSMLTLDCQAALEAVGIDSYVGFFHTDRPGRRSMALDLVEEFRAYIVDRMVLTLINLQIVNRKDFEFKENGAVLLNDKGRTKVLEYWQKRKHEEILHPFLNEKIKIGLLPHVQSMLLSRFIRGDLEMYPPFLMKG
ncbi:type I-C CRISPR-associated endonuclease Cas1c [Ignavigranum ruoffiae]|uniref:type I-C CRISPR-associated endonuclease Cas1c n=1 Tax=Ignavigranum ruoffiae TaxID=89093 RepID=UPI00205D2474|nr:type I-C CRISPR-associated endonuclease Cas1c [Ignavigranum ruoffiae]UPQ85921.1 type I-C CRISPR-associated endonuclease Cas1c [Ignavigranum ruoffiae]